MKGKLFLLALLLSACSIDTPNLTKEFAFKSGDQQMDFEVTQSCTYEVGVSFSKGNGTQNINNQFGHARKINMPAIADVSLSNKTGKVLLSKPNFGGDILEYRYGPDPLRLIAGKIHLEPGKYSMNINVKRIDKDFSGFKSMAFISADPKITCKSKADK